ncbi:amidase [Telmatospirillum sp.]|uniref:amidase n=1 Tax=Telmatospirillum sp. TaxID=2079197 RepID=UPI00283BBBF9|nr:amidase [Telmatospirillum sp.]MDR3436009.1 amidase [Telmatospirillum sp.]
MTPDDLGTLSAFTLAGAIRNGEVSAEQAVKAALSRAEAVNPRINAILSFDTEEAIEAGRAIDAGRRQGKAPAGALLGVPLAHKDMFDRIGRIATWGAKIRAGAPATRDATAIARLKAAGAVPFGALNMAEFAFGITGHNYQVGHCRNPHNPAHITGGSSSGSAAAVAAGVVPFALGSDTGGSIRFPSACCGIAGIRPTWGLVSRAGAMPLASSLDTIGPLARDVTDLALALSLMAGSDPADATAKAPAADYLAALGKSPRGLKIGVDRALLDTIDPEIAGLLREALAVLRDAGAVEVAVTLPDLQDLDRYAQLLQFAEASAYHARWMRERPQDYSDQVRTRLEDGFAVSAVDYIQALRVRPLIIEDWLSGPFRQADVLFLPILNRSVPSIAETDVGGGKSMTAMIASLLCFTRPLAYLGMPCMVLPTARDGKALPSGFQLLGRPYAETTLLGIGHAYQARVGVPQPVHPAAG